MDGFSEDLGTPATLHRPDTTKYIGTPVEVQNDLLVGIDTGFVSLRVPHAVNRNWFNSFVARDF